MSASPETSKVESGLAEKLKVVASMLGIIAAVAAVATFAGLKPEKKKMLEWEYVSKSSLVNESAAAGDKIQVFYDSAPIKQLTAITARLSNVGSIPIDANDVKDGVFPRVSFKQKIIGAELKGLSPRGIKAELVSTPNSVQIVHGLLNPGDTINVQILLDGDPGEVNGLPEVEYRIADIAQPATRYPTAGKPKVGVIYFSFAPAIEYFILIASIVAPFVCFFAVALLISSIWESLFENSKVRAMLTGHQILHNPSDSRPLNEQVASAFFLALPPPFDQRAQRAIHDMPPIPGESFDTYLARVTPRLERTLVTTGLGKLSLVNKWEAFATIVLLFGGIAAILVLAGSWHRLLTDS